MPNPGGKSRSRRRNPDEFGVSSLSLGRSSSRRSLDLETYAAARLSLGLTTAVYYAHAACELAELLERGYAAAEKRCADALWRDCLLAVSSAARLERTAETNEALDALLRAARRALPAARRAELERAHRRAAVARKRRERRRGEGLGDDGDRDVARGGNSSDDDDDDDDEDEDAPRWTRGAAPRRATFGDLPGDVLGLVLDRLHPHALARAACVSREWRTRAESASPWRAVALAAFGEKRCAAAAAEAGDDENDAKNDADPASASRARRSEKRCWRRAFLAARARWPDAAPKKHTGRAFCATCQTLAWFLSRGKNVSSCGCTAATFSKRLSRKKKSRPDAAVSAAAAALPFAVTPRRAARFLFRAARRKARKTRNWGVGGSGSDSSESDASSSSSGSASSSSDEPGERRLWRR